MMVPPQQMAPLDLRSAARSRRRLLLCWSSLPPEMINLILQCLSFPDCFNFGRVCSSWRRVLLASKFCCPPTRPPPLMVLFQMHMFNGGEETATYSILTGFFFNNGSKPPLKLLRSSMPTFLPYDRIVGSLSDWLVVASDRKSGLRLMNLTSHQQISLPSTTSDGTKIWHKRSGTTCFTVESVTLSSSPTSGDCVLVALGYHGNKGHLAYFKLGRDKEWTTFTEPRITWWDTMTFHNGEPIIIGNGTDDRMGILVYNLDPQPNLRAFYMPPMPIEACMYRWLVSSGGELLLVWLHENPQQETLMVYKFLGSGGWKAVECLGDRVLLLGQNAATSFCSQELRGTGFVPNCIYFKMYHDSLTKFSMADGSMETMVIPLAGGDHKCLYFRSFEWIVKHE